MSKAVLISIRPKWVEKIVNGEKTIEVRKTRPKLKTPFKAYIYCTMPDAKDPHNILELHGADGKIRKANGKIIGEFTCDRIYEIRKRGIPENFDYCYLSLNEWGNDDIETEIRAISASCVSKEELNAYGAKAPLLYGWHISDLLIYDQPRELTAFRRACKNSWYCESCAMYWENNGTCGNESLQIRRPPQSWCYVEAMKDE